MLRPCVFALLVAMLLSLVASCAGWMGGGGNSGDRDAATQPDATTSDASPLADATIEPCDPDLIDDFTLLGEVPSDTWRTVSVPACTQAEHFAVAAGGQILRLELTGLTTPMSVTVLDAHGTELATAQVTGTEGHVDFTVDTSGEQRLRLTRSAAATNTATTYEARLLCQDQCDLEATRYPIVLVHGAGGSTAFGLLNYFFDVEATLESYGYLPFAPSITAMGHSDIRAQDLVEAIDTILAETGASKVHLVGHSQAGLDFRVLLGGLGYGHRIATATSMSTPHRGYRPGLSEASAWFGMPTDAAYITGEFAALYPEDTSVPRYSWAAATCAVYDVACLNHYEDEVVAVALANTYLTVRTAYYDDAYGGDNDGVVPVSATEWGTFLGVLPADHWDIIGQVPAQRLGFFDHYQHYLDEARRLRTAELDLAL